MAHDISEAMESANEFLTGSLMNFKKQGNMDVSNELEEYRSIARAAFREKRYVEAKKYYDKVLKNYPDDYETAYLSSLCKGFSYMTDTTVKEVYIAYKKAVANIPVELDWDTITCDYAVMFADLIIAWFKKSDDAASRHAADWYSYNIKEFYEHADRSKLAVDYMDEVMPVILKSDMDNDVKLYPYGFWYCSMCRGFCCETMYYTINNRDLAITSSRYAAPLGYPVQVKAPYIKKYDDMCFELRKMDPTFQCIEDEWDSGFDRTNPPTTYEGQQQDNSHRRYLQIQVDREIAQRLTSWRMSGGPAKDAREKKIRRYMSQNPDDRTKYQGMKREIVILTEAIEGAQEKCEEVTQRIDEDKKLIERCKVDISDRTRQIEKLKNKIFGKSKAQAKIAELELEIEKIDKVILLKTEDIRRAQSTVEAD